MKKSISWIIKNRNHAQSPDNRHSNLGELERSRPIVTPRLFAAWVIATLVTTAVALSFALSLLVAPPAQAQAINAGSQPFANPSEVRYGKDSKLRMIMQIVSGKFMIPNVGTETMRQFRGWDAANPPSPTPTPVGSPSPLPVSPGPTLRARLGGQVQVSFLNQIDDSLFPYSFVTDSQPGVSDFGCDKSGTRDPKTGIILPYPGNDKFPNCFHGSSTANIHFHGTHTSPDGLGDNVLVQVLPQLKQPDWTNTFKAIFDSGKIPQKWAEMPLDYQNGQLQMVKQLDTDAANAAKKNGLPPPESLSANNDKMIASGQWPQYLLGAFPNFFDVPDYDKAAGAFNSGGNGYKAGQAPGTQWYHAHKHGSTALHIRNGLAGALIIESSHEGGYDHFIRKFYNWGETYGVHEKIIVFQQYDPIQNLERSPRGAKGPVSGGKAQTLVNGKPTPTITMQPGEVQLWRLINATEGNGPGIIKNNLFQTPGFTFKQTAMDGVQFSPANYATQPFLAANAPNGLVPGGLALAAGNRADLLVQAPTTPGIVAFKSGGATLFFVNVVAGTPVTLPNGAFPPATWTPMPAFLKDLSKPGPNDVINQNSPVRFQWEDGRAGQGLLPATPLGFPPHFMINGKQFGETGDVIDQCMPLDGLQDWILENYTSLAHPFHIHINPFQVIRIDTPTGSDTYNVYAPPNNFVWQDVIAIPPAKITANASGQITNVTPGRIRIRQTYLDFTGTYVLHCHILAHEDRGMMQLVRVVPAANYPGGCQNTVPAHH